MQRGSTETGCDLNGEHMQRSAILRRAARRGNVLAIRTFVSGSRIDLSGSSGAVSSCSEGPSQTKFANKFANEMNGAKPEANPDDSPKRLN
jgi:hypothetical protein